MNLSTVEIPTAGARETAKEYSAAAKTERDPGRRAELERIALAYRTAAKEGVQMIALTPTIAAGGTVTRTRVLNRGTDRERREEYLLPKLAACRWEASFCFTLGGRSSGPCGISPSEQLERPVTAGAARSDGMLISTCEVRAPTGGGAMRASATRETLRALRCRCASAVRPSRGRRRTRPRTS
jgi:hypothetical protein